MKPIYLSDDTSGTTFWLEDVKVEEFRWEFKVYESRCYSATFEELEPDDIDLYVSGTIKWDGCSHVYFGTVDDKTGYDGYIHLCGAGCWEDHVKLMSYLWSKAPSNIAKWDPC
jgi:hypothetical protein